MCVPERGIPIDGKKLRRLRDSKVLSQEGFARAIGVSGSWVGDAESGRKDRIARSIVEKLAQFMAVSNEEAVRRLSPDPDQMEEIKVRRCPFYDVKIPAGGWVDTEPKEQPDGFAHILDELPKDAFCLRILGDSMEPDYPSGSIVAFCPVRDGERGCEQFQNGKDYYFEHSDDKATFKRVFYEEGNDRFRLESLNKKYKPMYVPVQMKARMSRACGFGSTMRRID